MTAQIFMHVPDSSAFYRLLEPARVLDVPVVETFNAVTADTVITNRPILPAVALMVEEWVAEGRRVIIDMDDDFDHLPETHSIAGHFPTDHLHRACKAATVVTTTTPALADIYGYGHAEVIPNYVPAEYLSVTRAGRREQRQWVGWYGSLGAHPEDLQVCGDGVVRALQATGAQFAFLGPNRDAPRVRELLQWSTPEPDFAELGFVSRFTLPNVIAEFDVGIVPLFPNQFNMSKSWLKGIELASVGVPVVAAPTPEYERLAELGGCQLARTPADWSRQLIDLLHYKDLRQEQVAKARAAIADLTYERNAGKWSSIWYGDLI